MNPLEERLNRLEMRVRRYRNFNVLLCLLLVTVVTVAAREGVSPFHAKSLHQPVTMPQGDFGVQAFPDRNIPEGLDPDTNFAGKAPAQVEGTVRTRRLEIINDNEEAVVILTPSTKGGGIIYVNSPEVKELVYIGSSAASGNGLVLINSTEEKNLIALASDSETGDGYISIRNRNEVRLLSLFAQEDNPRIHINNAEHRNLAYLGANTSGNGLLSLKNKSGKPMVSVTADDMSGHLSLMNNNDKTIAYLGTYSDYLGTNSNGSGVLEIFSKNGTELITVGSNTADNGSVRVSNNIGTLGVALVAANEQGYVGIQNSQERLLVELTATPVGDGLVRTLSKEGITTWSSASVPGNTGSTSILRGDMDNDGDIDGDDFLIFSENFGKKE